MEEHVLFGNLALFKRHRLISLTFLAAIANPRKKTEGLRRLFPLFVFKVYSISISVSVADFLIPPAAVLSKQY